MVKPGDFSKYAYDAIRGMEIAGGLGAAGGFAEGALRGGYSGLVGKAPPRSAGAITGAITGGLLPYYQTHKTMGLGAIPEMAKMNPMEALGIYAGMPAAGAVSGQAAGGYGIRAGHSLGGGARNLAKKLGLVKDPVPSSAYEKLTALARKHPYLTAGGLGLGALGLGSYLGS